MHGLINQAIERFARDSYGAALWEKLAQQLDLGFSEFEAMLCYEEEVTGQVLHALAMALEKSPDEVLEDIGTYLVSHPNSDALRRLLRFSGVDFVEFLHSLDDLPARARLAVPDLDVPLLELREHTTQFFSLTIHAPRSGSIRFGHVIMGLLRAMADDYGALVLLDYKGGREGTEIIEIKLLETTFAAGRAFQLGVQA